MSTIIIGNGTSILDKPLGEVIDAFDTVVRMNMFYLTPVEYTGTKTTVWYGVKTAGKYKKYEHYQGEFLQNFGSFDVLTIPKRESHYKTLMSKFDKRVDVVPSFLNEGLTSIMYSKYKARGRSVPSAGLTAIAYYLKIKKTQKLYIHGFDHFTRKQINYYCRKNCSRVEKARKIHPSLIEKKIVDTWVVEGKVRRLLSEY